ncbi:pentachlorophenol 4-monooxygenase [Aspergillus unguis]
MSKSFTTDVLIVGGGPVGLTTAYSLARQSVSSMVAEQSNKDQLPMYGRATTLFPRTLELLDQLDLLDPMTQIGFVARNSVTFKDGQRVTTRGYHQLFDGMGSTYLDYILNIRQKCSEEVIRGAYERMGGVHCTEWKLEGFDMDHECADEYRITSRVRDLSTGEVVVVKSKYIVGCDGGTSTVRHLANIPFEGESTAYKWVRLDGIFKTNMPDSDLGFASIESKNHGNVLWVQLDHGAKRIGFAMSGDMLAKYGNEPCEEDVKAEAVKAMEPFSLVIEKVDWWTLYSIKQCIADTYISNGRVILAGDACHTHSSGAAQGMNTGIHDAVNLAWKLGGTIKGQYSASSSILETYDSERRTAAQRLIELDKAFSTAISGQIPASHRGLYTDAHALLTKLFDETVQFSLGLGVSYGLNVLHRVPTTGMVSAGHRAPDALVYPPGSLAVRMYSLLKNHGQWNVLIFAGEPSDTKARLSVAVQKLDAFAASMTNEMLRFVTIIGQNVSGGDKLFSIPRLGYMVFDKDQSAHLVYGISPGRGAVAVLRPDAIFATAVALDEVDGVIEFLGGLTGRECF